jgi:hypothetical protein
VDLPKYLESVGTVVSYDTLETLGLGSLKIRERGRYDSFTITDLTTLPGAAADRVLRVMAQDAPATQVIMGVNAGFLNDNRTLCGTYLLLREAGKLPVEPSDVYSFMDTLSEGTGFDVSDVHWLLRDAGFAAGREENSDQRLLVMNLSGIAERVCKDSKPLNTLLAQQLAVGRSRSPRTIDVDIVGLPIVLLGAMYHRHDRMADESLRELRRMYYEFRDPRPTLQSELHRWYAYAHGKE